MKDSAKNSGRDVQGQASTASDQAERRKSATAAETSKKLGLLDRLDAVDRDAEGKLPWWRRFSVWFPITVYLVSRIFVVIAGVVLSKNQMALPIGLEKIRITYPLPADPGYWALMTNWDGQWYRIIAEQGYPAVLPRAGWGSVDMNPWAFFPVFPVLTGILMKITGLPFVIAGPLLSTLIGVPAIYLLFRLIDRAVGRYEAIVVTISVCFYIASPIFSASYTESTALLMVVICLMLIRARKYYWLILALAILALSRNVVIAMVPVLIAHAVVRWRTGDEGKHPVRLRLGLAALAVYAAALTWLWPAIVSLVTQTPDAYNETMMAWKIETKVKLYLWWNLLYAYGGVTTQILGVLAIAAFAWFMLSKHSWRWGPELWGWMGAYPAYILLVTSTTPSRVRYALLAFPFALIIAWFINLPWLRRWRLPILGLIVVLGAIQMWWYTENYIVIDELTSIPLYYP